MTKAALGADCPNAKMMAFEQRAEKEILALEERLEQLRTEKLQTLLFQEEYDRAAILYPNLPSFPGLQITNAIKRIGCAPCLWNNQTKSFIILPYRLSKFIVDPDDVRDIAKHEIAHTLTAIYYPDELHGDIQHRAEYHGTMWRFYADKLGVKNLGSIDKEIKERFVKAIVTHACGAVTKYYKVGKHVRSRANPRWQKNYRCNRCNRFGGFTVTGPNGEAFVRE